MVDGAAVAAQVGFHQRSLFLALLSATGARSPVDVGLDHQRLLPLLLLLLFEQRSLRWITRQVTRGQDRKRHYKQQAGNGTRLLMTLFVSQSQISP